ncbi:MAG: BamA/TamA family outer membrane protein [Bacteroidia bacterium]
MKKVISTPIVCALLFTAYCFVFPSCNPTKRLTEGELLLNKNIIRDKSSGVEKNEIEPYIKQKPNRKMLFWKFHLSVYNGVNQDKMEKKKEKRDIKIDSINAKRTRENALANAAREAKGKKTKKLSLRKKESLTWREWLLSIGEPPVIYDSTLTKNSVKQVTFLMNNKGFFNSTVKDSVKVKKKKATVFYIIKAGKPYKIRNVSYEIKDDQLYYFVLSEASNSLIVRGGNYDLDLLEKERDRLTAMLRNQGYFLFAKDYIYFEVDSSLGTHEMDVTLNIKNPVVKIPGSTDTLKEGVHKRFTLSKIFVQTDYNSKLKLNSTDTLLVNNYYLLSTGKLRYNPKLITNAVFLTTGALYQQSDADLTYKRLSELKMFRSVQLQFVDVGNNLLECHIYLSNLPKQSFSAELDLINTSGTDGAGGNIAYQNNNILKGGEIFEVKSKIAVEVQKGINGSSENTSSANPFNTLELGEQVNLSVPRFMTPFGIEGRKSNNAKTNFTLHYDYQKRPDYERSISNIAYGYSWNETVTKRHIINPIDLSFVDIFHLSDNLRNIIKDSKDLFLQNSYSPHFTIGTRYVFIFSNQNIRKQQNFSYFKFGFEGAGNAMRGAANLIEHTTKMIIPTDPKNSNSFFIDGIPFSQFIRADFDYRYYKIVNSTDKMVYRIACGVGEPWVHGNLNVLPLEQSFFAGGPNDIRAWQARTLGPGGYQGATSIALADKMGDIKIEGNLEYRFNVVKLLNAALFLDAGNVWLNRPDPNYPLGEFELNKFIGQIAAGGGLGFRLDFNFFIIRLDGAVKIKDPAQPENDQWVFTHMGDGAWKKNYAESHGNKYPFFVFNFGIGYPF